MELFSQLKTFFTPFNHLFLAKALIRSLLWSALTYQLTAIGSHVITSWIEEYQLLETKTLLWVFMVLLFLVYMTLDKWRVWGAKIRLRIDIYVPFSLGILIITASSNLADSLLSLTLGWLFILGSQVRQAQKDSPPKSSGSKDLLNRKSTVDALARVILQEGGWGRKVALLGPWGSGKTFVLNLLKERLSNSNTESPSGTTYGFASANPWHCKSIEEFNSVIAQAFNEAIGGSSPTSHMTGVLSKIVKLLEHLPFCKSYSQIGATIHEILVSNTTETSEALIKSINKILKELDHCCIIYIEDFERASPEISKGILSMLDELRSLENTVIICALDQEKLYQNNAETQQGLIEKVFDVQITLPAVEQRDLSNLIKRYDFAPDSKLMSIWDSITNYLPTTARKVERFLKIAQLEEREILKNFESNEFNVSRFYLHRIIEIEDWNFSQMLFKQSPNEAEKWLNQAEPKRSPWFQNFVPYYSAQCHIGIINDFGDVDSLSRHWYIDGYRRNIHLNRSKKIELLSRWRTIQGERVTSYDMIEDIINEQQRSEAAVTLGDYLISEIINTAENREKNILLLLNDCSIWQRLYKNSNAENPYFFNRITHVTEHIFSRPECLKQKEQFNTLFWPTLSYYILDRIMNEIGLSPTSKRSIHDELINRISDSFSSNQELEKFPARAFRSTLLHIDGNLHIYEACIKRLKVECASKYFCNIISEVLYMYLNREFLDANTHPKPASETLVKLAKHEQPLRWLWALARRADPLEIRNPRKTIRFILDKHSQEDDTNGEFQKRLKKIFPNRRPSHQK